MELKALNALVYVKFKHVENKGGEFEQHFQIVLFIL